SVASETPARMAQDKRTRARVLRGMRFFSLEGRLLSGRSMALNSDTQLYLRTSRPTMGGCSAASAAWLPRCCRSSGDTYLLDYFPAAFLSAALIRSCQPRPSAWKWSNTSRSIRSVTCSLARGIAGLAFGSSAGLVVAALKAASAASRGSPGRRGRLVMSSPLLLAFALRGAIRQMAAVAERRLFGLLATAERHGEIVRDGVAQWPQR